LYLEPFLKNSLGPKPLTPLFHSPKLLECQRQLVNDASLIVNEYLLANGTEGIKNTINVVASCCRFGSL